MLTAREHYIAHALLEKIYIKRYGLKDQRTIKMIYAHTYMKGNGNYVNSYLYECSVMRRKNLMIGENNFMYGKKRCGKSNPMYNKKHNEKSKILMKKRWEKRIKNGFVSPTLGRKMSENQVLSMSKEFCVVSPEGEIIRGINLSEFCRKNNLDQGGFNKMINGKKSHCKGWKLLKNN